MGGALAGSVLPLRHAPACQRLAPPFYSKAILYVGLAHLPRARGPAAVALGRRMASLRRWAVGTNGSAPTASGSSSSDGKGLLTLVTYNVLADKYATSG